MRILLVHNEYGKVSGEEMVVRAQSALLQQRGHEVIPFFRSSAELAGQKLGAAKAFFTGIYNWSARHAMRSAIRNSKPDLVHVHNLFPLISPAVLGVARAEGVPVVMTVHNYRLVCPNGLHLLKGQVCEKCVGGREYNCMLNRCEGGLLKSTGYALRSTVARQMGFYRKNVTLYSALTEFQRKRLIDAGYPADRVTVIPNMGSANTTDAGSPLGEWVGYVGRVSHEKGIPTLLRAAAALPEIQFRLAGAFDRMPEVLSAASKNVQFVGHLHAGELHEFYRRSRIVVLCSTCFEGFPTMLLEAMLHGKPVICSRIGGLPEIVEQGSNGFLFTPGDADDLGIQIKKLWENPELCQKMGQAGRTKAMTQYSRDAYYDRLMAIYDRARLLGPGGERA